MRVAVSCSASIAVVPAGIAINAHGQTLSGVLNASDSE